MNVHSHSNYFLYKCIQNSDQSDDGRATVVDMSTIRRRVLKYFVV